MDLDTPFKDLDKCQDISKGEYQCLPKINSVITWSSIYKEINENLKWAAICHKIFTKISLTSSEPKELKCIIWHDKGNNPNNLHENIDVLSYPNPLNHFLGKYAIWLVPRNAGTWPNYFIFFFLGLSNQENGNKERTKA